MKYKTTIEYTTKPTQYDITAIVSESSPVIRDNYVAIACIDGSTCIVPMFNVKLFRTVEMED